MCGCTPPALLRALAGNYDTVPARMLAYYDPIHLEYNCIKTIGCSAEIHCNSL